MKPKNKFDDLDDELQELNEINEDEIVDETILDIENIENIENDEECVIELSEAISAEILEDIEEDDHSCGFAGGDRIARSDHLRSGGI